MLLFVVSFGSGGSLKETIPYSDIDSGWGWVKVQGQVRRGKAELQSWDRSGEQEFCSDFSAEFKSSDSHLWGEEWKFGGSISGSC